MHLNTGFVGTAYLCKALTKAGLSGEAYTLLFKVGFPELAVRSKYGGNHRLERWNSVLPDGK